MRKSKIKDSYPVSYVVTRSAKWKELTQSAKVLYNVLCMLSDEHSRKHGWFFRSNEDLVADSRMHINSVNNAKKELQEARLIQFITVTNYFKRKKATKYRIVMHVKLAQ